MSSIILPLYIYPLEGSWQPLLSLAEANSNVDFLAIVNPFNGPGDESLPDASYIEAITSLASYPNVGLLGYVHSLYGQRAVSEIGDDIAIYGGWEEGFAGLGGNGTAVSLRGIFVDEASAELDYVSQMEEITSRVRTTWADVLQREATVVYNPGVVVDPSFYEHADLIVAFEAAEANRPAFVDEGLSGVAMEDRGQTAVIVHTYEESLDKLGTLVGEMDDLGIEYLFITDQVGGQYNDWPWTLEASVDIMAQRVGGGGGGEPDEKEPAKYCECKCKCK